MNRAVLVTGGSGFLGGYVVDCLVDAGKEVFYTTRQQSRNVNGATPLIIDITNPTDFAKYRDELERIECLVHAAATVTHVPSEAPGDDISAQVIQPLQGLVHLLNSLPNLKKIVYISSGSAQIAEEDPSFYGMGKLVMEQTVRHYAEQKDIFYVSLRFPQLYGPGEPHGTFVSTFITSVGQNIPVQLVNNGIVERDVLYVKDAALSVVHAVNTQHNGTYAIADPEKHNVAEVLNNIIKLSNPEYNEIVYKTVDEVSLAKSLAIPSDITEFGYTLQYSLTEGLKETIEHWSKG